MPGQGLHVNMGFDDYKIVIYRQDDCSRVAEIPALGGCYAPIDTYDWVS